MDHATINGVQARVGTTLRDKWLLGRVIGSGSTAAIYEGTHRTNGKRVAVKVMHPSLADSAEMVARFQREGYIANKVGHPGAVAILDDDTTHDGAPFLVMDRLEGESLASILERAKDGLSVLQVLSIAHDVLDILVAAHAHGITHRDIKPGNVFLTNAGQVMLLDFGIARLRERVEAALPGGADLTMRLTAQMGDASALGTPRYMPPEQARRAWGEVDAQSDLWSVGAMMFRLLTGKPVHDHDDAGELLLAAMTERARSVGSIGPVPTQVAVIVDMALEFEKGDRWPNARAMQMAIRVAASQLKATDSKAGVKADTKPEVAPRDASIRVNVLPAPKRVSGPALYLASAVLAAIGVLVAFKPLDAHLRLQNPAVEAAAPSAHPNLTMTVSNAAAHEVSLPSSPGEGDAPTPQLHIVPIREHEQHEHERHHHGASASVEITGATVVSEPAGASSAAAIAPRAASGVSDPAESPLDCRH